MRISELIQVHSIGYRLQDVKVNFSHDIKIEAPSVSLESRQGDTLSIPRWVAEVLSSEKLVEVQDVDMVNELHQAILKENAQGTFNLSSLDVDFYIKINLFAKKLPQQDYDRIESMIIELIRKRRGKIIALADSSQMTADIATKLTIEEQIFFDSIHRKGVEFKKQILGDKK